MYLSTIVVATVATVAPLANAHGAGLPQILGLNVADLKSRDLLRSLEARITDAVLHPNEGNLAARQDSPKECGEGIGSCPTGQCCSRAFYCGATADHCYSPGCNYKFGPGCPENHPPTGSNTSSISRDKLGSVKYGGDGVFQCVKPGTVALTFDDGPQEKFTEHILDLFKSHNAKATFFITGNNINKGQVDVKYQDVVKRMDAEGHQIASHTWTHLDLSKISAVDRKNQMWMNEMAIRNIVGKIPTYMRPPYSSCTKDSGCDQDMADLGYHITNFKLDTDDYNRNNASAIQGSKDLFKSIMTKDGAKSDNSQWLAIAHDILDQTANNLTEYMLSTLTQLGYRAVTVGECLGDPKENWYRKADGPASSTTNSPQKNETASNGTPSGSASPTPVGKNSAVLVQASMAFIVAILSLSFAFAI
ncbi:hypothetical protein GQ44DRAFT_688868 [Phaeosphaeriaceae sp. PMI808]|nr:hypothetical protein GQ44DRAFT_688868 [Phaeosphaeriaceae sp. PMI808]